MTTYFVSAETGSDTNAGKSSSSPLATLQAAENVVKAGDTVEVMNGTYTASPGGDVLQITKSGTASAPITFEAMPGQSPVINSSGDWNAILVQSSFVIIQGFTVVGDAASITLAQDTSSASTNNPDMAGNGIFVTSPGSGHVPNHVTIQNNTVSFEPGGGIGSTGADYINILNNTVFENAHWSGFANSGISIASSVNSDSKSGVHSLISGNTSFNNTELKGNFFANGTITDGEGIILDSNTNYTGVISVQNNIAHGNSGAGIESFLTNNAIINGNTAYANLTNPGAAGNGQIFINQSNNNTVTNNSTVAPVAPACFLASTRIRTDDGDIAVEDLTPGQMVVTAGGRRRPIAWIGHRHLDLSRHNAPPEVQPIRIRADALGDGCPARDLFLSPAHALFIEGALVPVWLLVNGTSILRETRQEVLWFHVELETHDILLAEGAPSESYLDTGNRGAFENAGEPLILHPTFSEGLAQRAALSCAPLLDDPAAVEPIWRRLASRAHDLGYAPPDTGVTTSDPLLGIRIGQRILWPVSSDRDHCVFALPAHQEPAYLVSRKALPSDPRPWLHDSRTLGVAVRHVKIRRGSEVDVISPDHPGLIEGWWPHEGQPPNLWRWTNGEAVLPLPRKDRPTVVEIQFSAAVAYPAAVAIDRAA
jgi:hypothetical protein